MVTGIALTIAVFALIIGIGNRRDINNLQLAEERKMKAIIDVINETLRKHRECSPSLQ